MRTKPPLPDYPVVHICHPAVDSWYRVLVSVVMRSRAEIRAGDRWIAWVKGGGGGFEY